MCVCLYIYIYIYKHELFHNIMIPDETEDIYIYVCVSSVSSGIIMLRKSSCLSNYQFILLHAYIIINLSYSRGVDYLSLKSNAAGTCQHVPSPYVNDWNSEGNMIILCSLCSTF